ncbi:RICIN domain-containing protein [Nocardia sp. NPDC058705]|uniref:RICIN domain-containing protein n=1 Tax=Nocardia sp. NPDC058705 TaxID=3346609 RepID=UPI003698F389
MSTTSKACLRHRIFRVAVLTGFVIGLGALTPAVATAEDEPYILANLYSGLVVDVPAPNGSTANTFTVLWSDWGGANQRFDLVPIDPNNPNSDFLIKVRHAGKCLDVNNARGDDGARIQTFDCYGGASQRWYTEIVRDPYCQPMTFCGNATTIRARHSGKCLDAHNPNPSLANRPKQGTHLQQWTCFNNVNQFWSIRGGPGPILR